MLADLLRLSRAAGMKTSGDGVDIIFQDERRQRIEIDTSESGSVRLWAVVARRASITRIEDPLMVACRNRVSELVGFDIDRMGRLMGECWIPAVALTVEEWALYLQNFADACDRVEYLLTGADG